MSELKGNDTKLGKLDNYILRMLLGVRDVKMLIIG